jgi:hypothetical protein
MNLLRYDIGQEYKPHHDYFGSSDWTKSHGNRVATVLMYLADVEDGGETIFPSAEGGPLLVKPRRVRSTLSFLPHYAVPNTDWFLHLQNETGRCNFVLELHS